MLGRGRLWEWVANHGHPKIMGIACVGELEMQSVPDPRYRAELGKHVLFPQLSSRPARGLASGTG